MAQIVQREKNCRLLTPQPVLPLPQPHRSWYDQCKFRMPWGWTLVAVTTGAAPEQTHLIGLSGSILYGKYKTTLTHWGRVTHICVSKLTIIGSDNGLSPDRRQAIIWTNAGILLIGPLGVNFNEILIKINTFPFKKMHLKMASAKWRLFLLGLNVLTSMLKLLTWAYLKTSNLIKIKCEQASPFKNIEWNMWRFLQKHINCVVKDVQKSPRKFGLWAFDLIEVHYVSERYTNLSDKNIPIFILFTDMD